jgi:anti-sigma factor ChrR (cupin superfamily)
MDALCRSLRDFLKIDLDDGAVDRLPWRDFGNGLLMARLARQDRSEVVLYRIRADAKPDAFLKHEHLGGEIYLVLKGRIVDETGEYQQGDFVFLKAKSVHTPRAIGETLVLVLWPEGVRIIEDETTQPSAS